MQMKSTYNPYIKYGIQSFFLFIVLYVFLYYRCLNLVNVLDNPLTKPLTSSADTSYQAFGLVALWILAIITFYTERNYFYDSIRALVRGCVISIFGIFYLDFAFILAKAVQDVDTNLTATVIHYLSYFWKIYVFLTLNIVVGLVLLKHDVSKINYEKSPLLNYVLLGLGVVLSAILLTIVLPFIAANIFTTAKLQHFITEPLALACSLNTIYVAISAWVLWQANELQREYNLHGYWFLGIVGAVLFTTLVSFLLNIYFIFYPSLHLAWDNGIYSFSAIGFAFDEVWDHWIVYLPLIAFMLINAAWFGKLKVTHIDKKGKTTGNFGRASWATPKNLQTRAVYDSKTGSIGGADAQGKLLYFPLMNKLTIAPPSGGKTAASGIVALLTENRPMFVFDVKGELWVTTARYRAKQMGRDVILIDPYGVTKTKAFSKGKPESLLKTHHINPFDYIPEDEHERDRMINSFAQSFIVTEHGYGSQHFDENARTIIRGYIDYIMKTFKKDNRNLVNLYELMAEEVKSSKNTFSAMSELSGRAAAAANQISRVGANERGSILSTSYRQVDWIGDKNMQKTLMDSTFDLRDFLKGNMDIYVVLPQEQVREHSRLMRILLSLLKYLILSADPDELPHKKMLFLLDELAQLGYCPDVEEFIEVLRSRGVVIWTVFQSNDQIELYKKPDLFRGMPMKQIFTLDDVPTMRWIQALGGKESVITQSFSKQKGHSWRESGLATGNSSHTEASSRHETGVDLIQLSDIREMPNDEQIIFIHGQKPVRCKKAFYFKHPFFAGKFDENPLERRKQ